MPPMPIVSSVPNERSSLILDPKEERPEMKSRETSSEKPSEKKESVGLKEVLAMKRMPITSEKYEPKPKRMKSYGFSLAYIQQMP